MKTYNIKFNGKNCENQFYCKYQNDMYAIEDAWDALKSQPYPPTEGKSFATCAEVEVYNEDDQLNPKSLIVIGFDGNITQ